MAAISNVLKQLGVHYKWEKKTYSRNQMWTFLIIIHHIMSGKQQTLKEAVEEVNRLLCAEQQLSCKTRSQVRFLT